MRTIVMVAVVMGVLFVMSMSSEAAVVIHVGGGHHHAVHGPVWGHGHPGYVHRYYAYPRVTAVYPVQIGAFAPPVAAPAEYCTWPGPGGTWVTFQGQRAYLLDGFLYIPAGTYSNGVGRYLLIQAE